MTIAERIVTILAAVAPLPLTYDDLVDELGINRKHVQNELTPLVKAGRVRREGGRGLGRGNGEVQLYAAPEREGPA